MAEQDKISDIEAKKRLDAALRGARLARSSADKIVTPKKPKGKTVKASLSLSVSHASAKSDRP